MRIHVHDEISDQGKKVGEHVVHTEDPIALNLVKTLAVSAAAASDPYWSAPSNHPAYPGMTRLQVLKAEIVRLNDTAARTALGL